MGTQGGRAAGHARVAASILDADAANLGRAIRRGERSRYVDQFISGGADSVTVHVEVDEPKEPTLRAIRAADRAAGLAVSPQTPIEALDPYRGLAGLVMAMG